jgi:DsbC/DsbD-like thiol-disulfide interchange protein
MAALRLDLAPGWKTYWRAPGDVGIPPRFDWSGSDNLRSLRYHWPSPVVFDAQGARTVGYRDQLILPIEITAQDPAQPVILRGRIDIGICNDICVPADLTLTVRLEGDGSRDALIGAALKNRPLSAREAGVTDMRCKALPNRNGMHLKAQITLPALGPQETVIFEGGPGIWVDDSVTQRQAGQLLAEADMLAEDRMPFALNRSALTVTVIGADRSVEIHGCPAQ